MATAHPTTGPQELVHEPLEVPCQHGHAYRQHPYTCRQCPSTLLDLKTMWFFSPAKQALNCLFNMVPLLFSGVDKVLMLKGCTCSQLISGYLV